MTGCSILQGNCLDVLPTLESNSVDSIVTDPPYGISFMGKKWDYDVPSVDVWRECFRVLKPGGHLLSFAGTRTQHRMAVNIEDAGFEIRDMIAWVYGSGFPKSLNVGKAVNSLETNEWLKISKGIDNINKMNILETWKRNVKTAGIQLSKSLTEVGNNIPEKFFVPDIAVLFTNQKNEPLNAIIAELKSCGLNPISEESIIIVQESAEQKTELSPSHARYVVKLSPSQKAKHFNIFTAQCNVKEWLKENIMVNHRVGEALKTLRGNKKYSNEEITSVLCAVLTDILKLTILNQSKTFQNLDTNQKTECASAINVIITEYTAENLISNTVDILKSKAVDKIQGNEREFVCKNPANRPYNLTKGETSTGWQSPPRPDKDKGSSPWEGFGTALKPALEPITVARKPIEKGLSVAENCLKWGVGGINIDGCRVEYTDGTTEEQIRRKYSGSNEGNGSVTNNFGVKDIKMTSESTLTGRFPANLIHDGSDEVVGLFPVCKQAKNVGEFKQLENMRFSAGGEGVKKQKQTNGEIISASASRFFYCAKASKRERNIGIDCYLTVKYNNLCKEENTVAVQLLKRVISDTEVVSFSTGESGENIMVQCHKDSLSTILTEINRIIELKILNLLTHSLTNESTQDVNLEMGSGGNLVESVESLRKYLLTITKENRELALGASRVALQTLLSIKEKENWQEAKNFHSTVKPIALMEYLVKLVSREGQVVLDPFMGSGTTGMACKKLDREFIGIEMMPEYMEIAKRRIGGVKESKQLEQLNLLKDNK